MASTRFDLFRSVGTCALMLMSVLVLVSVSVVLVVVLVAVLVAVLVTVTVLVAVLVAVLMTVLVTVLVAVLVLLRLVRRRRDVSESISSTVIGTTVIWINLSSRISIETTFQAGVARAARVENCQSLHVGENDCIACRLRRGTYPLSIVAFSAASNDCAVAVRMI